MLANTNLVSDDKAEAQPHLQEEQWDARLSRLIDHYREQGHDQLVRRPYIASSNTALNLGAFPPPMPTLSKGQLQITGMTSSLLFAKDNQLYEFSRRNIYNDTMAGLKTAREGDYIFIVIMKKGALGNPPVPVEFELRANKGTGTSHPSLVYKGEDFESVVAAGEFYVQAGKVVMVNDKSGNFHKALAQKKIDQSIITDFFFHSYYKDEKFGFFHATADDNDIKEELRRRGYTLLMSEKEAFGGPASSKLGPSFFASQQQQPVTASSFIPEKEKDDDKETHLRRP